MHKHYITVHLHYNVEDTHYADAFDCLSMSVGMKYQVLQEPKEKASRKFTTSSSTHQSEVYFFPGRAPLTSWAASALAAFASFLPTTSDLKMVIGKGLLARQKWHRMLMASVVII